MNIRKRFKKFIILLCVITFTFSIISKPRESKAIGAEITALLGGAAYSGSSLAGLGTAVGVLGVAGLVIVGGAGLWYLGDKLYNKWQTDRILNRDGSVTVNDALVQSTQEFIDDYNHSTAQPIQSSLTYNPIATANIFSNRLDGKIVSVAHNSHIIGSTVFTGSDITIPANFDFTVKANVNGAIYFALTFIVNGSVYENVIGIGTSSAYAGQEILVNAIEVGYKQINNTLQSQLHVELVSGNGTLIKTERFNYVDSGIYYSNFPSMVGYGISTGVKSVDGYEFKTLPVSTGSISLDAPVLNNTGSISAQRIIDTYGRDKIITVDPEWSQTIPMNPSVSVNPSIVRPVEIPEVREVDDPITYPDTDNPTLPGEVPSIWDWLWRLLKGIWDAITSIPTLLMSLWQLLKSLLESILEWIVAIPSAIAAVPTAITEWIKQRIKSPPNIPQLPQLFINMILILIALISFFVAVLAYILSIRNIMADPSLLPSLVQQGIMFTKNINFPVFNMSLYTIVTTTLFIFIVIRVVGMLRKSIHAKFG